MFVENEPVIYQGMCGVISFIGSNYVIMELPPAQGRNPSRVLIFRDQFKDVISSKQSTK